MAEQTWMADEMLSEEEKKRRMLQKIVDAAKSEMAMGTGHEGEYSKHGDFDESKIFNEQFVTTEEDGKRRIWDMMKTRSADEWAELLEKAIDVKPYDGMPFKWMDGGIYTYTAPPVNPAAQLQDQRSTVDAATTDVRRTDDVGEIKLKDVINELLGKKKEEERLVESKPGVSIVERVDEKVRAEEREREPARPAPTPSKPKATAKRQRF